MKFVCKLNRKIYSCVAANIATDDVIITDERIEHIKHNHPSDYELFGKYIPTMIENPDYILSDSRPHTAVVLKAVQVEGIYLRLALRLITPNDNSVYKNSVITFMRIHQKEWNRMIKNKIVLYKSE